jgi:hypothetical protein
MQATGVPPVPDPTRSALPHMEIFIYIGVGILALLFVIFIVRNGIEGFQEGQQDTPIVYSSHPDKPIIEDSSTVASWSSPRRMLQILVIAFFSSFFSLLSIDHPRWNWANCIGGALATVTFSVIIASLLIGLLMLFSDYRPPRFKNKFLAFAGALAIPILVVSPLLIMYQYDSVSRDAENSLEFDRMRR